MAMTSDVSMLLPVPELDSDEGENAESVPYVTQNRTFPKKLGVVTVLVAVTAFVVVVWASNSLSDTKKKDKKGDVVNVHEDIVLAEVTTTAMEAAQASFKDWAAGKFAVAGGKCVANGGSMILPGFKATTNTAIIYAGIASGYSGLDGMCAWQRDLEQFSFKTSKVAMYDLGDGRIVTTFNWTPTLMTGKQADHAVTDASLVLWQNGKMAWFRWFFSEPWTLEGLFVNSTRPEPKERTGNMKAWLGMRGVWAQGGFKENKCQENVAQYVSPSFEYNGFPDIKVGIKQKYTGQAGFCAWIHDLEQFDWSTMRPADFAIDEHEFLMVNSVTPSLVNKGPKAAHVSQDVALITYKNEKVTGFKYFFSQPDAWTGLFTVVE